MNWFIPCFTLFCLAYAAALLHEHGLLRPLIAATLGIWRRRPRGEALVLLLLVFWAVKVGGSKPDPGASQGGQQQSQAPTSGVVATNTVQAQQGTDQAGAATNSSSVASSSNQVASSTNASSEVSSSNVVAISSSSTPEVSSSNQVVSSTNASSGAASSNTVAVSSNSTPVVATSNQVFATTNAAPVAQVPELGGGVIGSQSPSQLRGLESNTAVWQSYAGPVWPFDDFTSNAIAGMAATALPPIPDAMLASGLVLFRVTTNTVLIAAGSNASPIRAWLRHGADNRGVSVDTPFPVIIGTGTYSRIGILANGRLAFGYATYQRQPTGDLPFATSYPVVTVAPFWGPFSLLPSAGSVVWTRTLSTNSFVVCWENLLQDGDPARQITVQCEICRDGDVRFLYGALADGSAAAGTVGVQNMGEGWSYSHGQTNRIMEGMTVTLRPVGLDGWAEADPDGDELSNFDEFMLGTDPHLADTDGDGPSDYWEVTHGFDPLVPQLGDSEPDSDGDLVPDRWENWFGTDAYNPESGPQYFLDPAYFSPWGAPADNQIDVVADIVSSRPCVLRLEGDGQVSEIPWMPGLSPTQLVVRLTRGQPYVASLSRVPAGMSFPTNGFWWANLSFSPVPGSDDLGWPATTDGGILSYNVGSVRVQTLDRNGDFWAVPGQAAAATNNLAPWRIEIVPPEPFCACSTCETLNLTEGSLVDGPVEWLGLPPIDVRTGNPLVFDPSTVTPGHYTVTAYSVLDPLVTAQTEVDICHVGFAQSAVWLSAGDTNAHGLALSDDTYVTGGVYVWSEPPGIDSLSFVPAGLDPGVYTVYVWDGMCGVAQTTVYIAKIDINGDYNRDGNPVDDPGEANAVTFGGPKGFVILANNDDDDGDGVPDAVEDGMINGANDLADIYTFKLASLGIAAGDIPSGLTLELSVENPSGEPSGAPAAKDRVRIFRSTAQDAQGVVGPDPLTDKVVFKKSPGSSDMDIDLLGGTDNLEMGIEGIEYGREVILVLTAKFNGQPFASDSIRLLVAPFLVLANTDVATKVYVSQTVGWEEFYSNTIAALSGVVTAVGGGGAFIRDYGTFGATRSAPGQVERKQCTIMGLQGSSFDNLLDGNTGWFFKDCSDTRGGGGNIEASPAFSGFPYGRIIVGNTLQQEARTFLQAQKVQTDNGSLIELPLDWKNPGHVDEVMAIVPAGSGFKVLVADLQLAIDLLRNNPSEETWGGYETRTNILSHYEANSNRVLSITSHLAAVRSTLSQGLGLPETSFVKVPVAFSVDADPSVSPYLPNMINMLVVNPEVGNPVLIIPHPFFIPFGTNLFANLDAAQVAATMDFVDTTGPHFAGGEAHCATNVRRTAP